MNRCPITYEPCGEARYSRAGLRLLSPNLERLNDFPYDAARQRQEAVVRGGKMSIQGVQPKLSVRLDAKAGVFVIVDQGGRFVLKPQHGVYPNLPENEGLTMHLAKLCGIEVPVSGIVRSVDGTWSYFVRRFDRTGHSRRVAVEDFAQLGGLSRETKYDFSMERLVGLLDTYCTFPAIEKVKLLKRSLFNFLVGNEDMHLKNFSLISRQGKVELAPAYDFLSTTVAYLALGKRIGTIEGEDRQSALSLSRALRFAETMCEEGVRDTATLRSQMTMILNTVPDASIDYVSIADAETLDELVIIDRPALVSLAVRIGKVRLIDNVILRIGD